MCVEVFVGEKVVMVAMCEVSMEFKIVWWRDIIGVGLG